MDNGAVRRVSSPTFVGRAEQVATFDRTLAGAAQGEPSALLVAGESGVGKTRLITECAERADAAGARVLTGDCVELGEGELPYAPIVGALRDLQRELGPGDLADLLEHRILVARERPQRRHQRGVGQLALAQLHAFAAQRPGAAVLRARRELGDEPRLAHARLPRDEGD